MGRSPRIALLLPLLLAPGCQYVSGVTDLAVVQRELGEECTHDWLCASGHCADGICCDTECDTECEGCLSDDAPGTCTPHAATIDPDNDCEGLGICDGARNCTGGQHLWSIQLGGETDERIAGLAVDGTGHVVLAITFAGSVTVGAETHLSVGLWDVLLVKLNPDGTPLWSRSFGDPGRDIAHGIALDGDGNAFVVGTFTNQLDIGTGGLARAKGMAQFVAKFGPNGDSRWVQIFNDTGAPPAPAPPIRISLPLSVAVTPAGEVYVAGRTEGVLQSENPLVLEGQDDVFVARLAGSNGVVQWRESFDADRPQHTLSYPEVPIVIDSSGRPVIAGTFKTTLQLGTPPLESEGVEQVDPADLFCARLNPDGTVHAAERFGDGAPQKLLAIAAAENEAIVLAGTFDGELDLGGTPPLVAESGGAIGGDIFLAKLDGTLDDIWSDSYTGTGPQAPFTVSVDSSLNVILAGGFQGDRLDFGGGELNNSADTTVAGEEDIFVAKFSSEGVHLLSKRHGQQGSQYATASAIDGDLNVYLAGSFGGPVGFGGARLVPFGPTDIFIAKLTP